SHGIFAEFGAKAINAFADAVAAIGASQASSLGTRGAIPNREEFQLLITGTALGSFGFELEEAPKDAMLFPKESLIESAIEQTKRIMKASLGTDDDLTEAISEADPRAVETLRSFFKTIADHEAVCALDFKGDVFRFADVGQVRRSEGRLSKDNIHEDDKIFNGYFLGVLPNHRNFELKVIGNEEAILGKDGADIEDENQINQIVCKQAQIKVNTKQVGTGRVRYELSHYSENSD
ncbi:MAG: hypothetical protein HQK92_08495, partial [Nitrospirae bacterium]|nr:hypothetical protein [Nitrospirota bacterium]